MCIGFVVNPVAGMGGRVGLKGTDGVVAQARALGATPVAPDRARRALQRLADRLPTAHIIAAPGPMGAEIVVDTPFAVDVLDLPLAEETTAADTRAAVVHLAARGVELLLFAGGDGTTRDIFDAVGSKLPILGVPTGVKMQSGVFATTPERAGDVAAAFLGRPGAPVREAEVVDLDEVAAREGRIVPQFHGAVFVPDDRLHIQSAKVGAFRNDIAHLDAVAAEFADRMDPRRLYVLGPGTTMRLIGTHVGIDKTLLGIDVVRGGKLIAADVDEQRLLQLVEKDPATLVLGVVGGQGALIGRGNQQLSPAVIRQIGADNIEIVAGLTKLLSLDPPLLRVDTGDPQLDAVLSGYRRVHIAPGRTLIYKVDR